MASKETVEGYRRLASELRSTVQERKQLEAKYSESIKALNDALKHKRDEMKLATKDICEFEGELRIAIEEMVEDDDSLLDAGAEGLSFSDRITFEIEDESALPDKYKIADTKKIREFVQRTSGEIQISGVRIIRGKSSRVKV